jgi:SseB protein N-terminal domain
VTGSSPPGSEAPRLDALLDVDLLVPIRSSSGTAPDPDRIGPDAYRHGMDESGERFIAAFSSDSVLEQYGPPGSDHVRVPSRELFERAEAAQERIVVDPGAPTQVEIAIGVLPFLAAGIDPNRPDALRARRPVGGLPPLDTPDAVPEPFGSELRAALADLAQVERAWLLRAGDAWTVGIELVPDAVLGDFDAVRNRLHAVATEHLGSRRALAVTDLRAPSLREEYDATAAPFYVRQPEKKGLISRLFGR